MKNPAIKIKSIFNILIILAVLAAMLIPAMPVAAGSSYSPITVWLGPDSSIVSADDYATLLATYSQTIMGTYNGNRVFNYSGVPIYRIAEFAFPTVSSLTGYNILTADSSDYKVVYGPNLIDNTPVKGNDNLIIATSGTLDNASGTNFPRSACSTFTAGNRFNNNISTLKLQYTIQVPAPANGSITPISGWYSGSNNPWTNSSPSALGVDYNSSQSFILTPSEGYVLSSLTDNDVDVTSLVEDGVYTINNITTNHNLVADFELPTFTISATGDASGTATADPVIVAPGGSSIVTLSPTTSGYGLFSLTANGADVTSQVAYDTNGGGTYTLTNVTDNHTISATFDKLFVTMITADSSYLISYAEFKNISHVSITTHALNSSEVMKNYTWEGVPVYVLVNKIPGVTPTGYSIKSVATDNYTEVVGPTALTPGINVTGNDNLTLADKRTNLDTSSVDNYTANGTLASPEFSSMSWFPGKVASIEVVYTIGTSASNGTIEATGYTAWSQGPSLPSGMYAKGYNSSQAFTLTPSNGYVLSSLMDNDVNVTGLVSGGVYTLTNITSNHTLAANFTEHTAATFTISTVTNGHGTAVANPETVTSGDSSAVTITPHEGYAIAAVLDNETDVTSQVVNGVYTLNNVTANHAISVTFNFIPVVTINLSTPPGTITEGDTFDVSLMINTNIAVRGWQTNIVFNPAKLTANSVTEGNFMSNWAAANGDSTIKPIDPTINNTTGQITDITYAITGTANLSGPTGSGTLCTISFTAKEDVSGVTAITPVSVIVSDVDGNTIPGVTVIGGEVTIVPKGPPTFTVDLETGWNTFSTPVSLDPQWDSLGQLFSGANISSALGYDAETQAWFSLDNETVLKPCQAIFVFMDNETSITLPVHPDLTAPQSTPLYAGWNLVSLANLEAMDVDIALTSVKNVTGGLTGYIQVVSPELGSQDGWTYVTGQPVAGKKMKPFEGYWVYMLNDGELAGFTTTPLD